MLVIGAPAFRGLAYEPGRFTGPGTRVFVITSNADDALCADADCAIVGPISLVIRALLAEIPMRPTQAGESGRRARQRSATPSRWTRPTVVTTAGELRALGSRLRCSGTDCEEPLLVELVL